MTRENFGPFWGGLFLNSCLPLETTLNWCSHNCHYCFANLNQPGRKANFKAIYKVLAEYRERDSYASQLLREGYPVVLSNHVDPFARSNDFQAMPLIEVMLELGIPFSLQTKGGKRALEALEMIGRDRPIAWYISLATLDADVIRRVEPGAPLPEERLALIEQAIALGHRVCVGINPLVPQWLPDPEPLTQTLAQLGVHGVWLQPMHLSRQQLKNMPARGREALGEDVINQALARRKHPSTHECYVRTTQAARAAGLETYDSQQGDRSDYFQAYKDVYPKRFPLMQDWVNHCHDTKQDGDLIFWSEFRDYFVPQLPQGEYGLREHLTAVTVRQLFYGMHIPQRMTYEELLLWVWRCSVIPYCPGNVQCFGWAAEWELQSDNTHGWTQLLDDDNLPIIIFRPRGTNRCLFTQYGSVETVEAQEAKKKQELLAS